MTDSRTYINNEHMAQALATYVKAERVKAGVTNQEICDKLKDKYGIIQTSDNLKNKINRGTFGAQLLIMVLSVLESDILDVNEVLKLYNHSSQES